MGVTEEYNADIRERSSRAVFNISHRKYTEGLCCPVLCLFPAAFNCTDFPHQVWHGWALDRQTVGGNRRDLLDRKL